MRNPFACSFAIVVCFLFVSSMDQSATQAADPIAALQAEAVKTRDADWGHWGPDPESYSSWRSHSNRLIPVYSFGMSLDMVSGSNSLYRNAEALQRLYGYLPTKSVNPEAEYFDQTDVYRLQKAAVEAGKKRVILFVYDGMDWHTTRAAAIAKSGRVAYDEGRGQGLHFLDYRGAPTDYGYFVTSPHNSGTAVNVDKQSVKPAGDALKGGYDAALIGSSPWTPISDPDYPIGKSKITPHAYTDSASSATSLTAGIKTYNNSVNVDPMGREVLPIARTLQEQGFAVGVVTSVPISHATPACAYANNVHRNDYQDITRDLLGRPSVYHPGGLDGVDVLIGGGVGIETKKDAAQGENFVAGNKYLTAEDLAAIDVENGGKYVVAQRTEGVSGKEKLSAAVKQAKADDKRLFGYFGVGGGHLPYQTADGNYDPVDSIGGSKVQKAEVYSKADVHENVNLREMALAAIEVLDARSDQWWLMIESGDVDWASHSNNIDNAIGAIHSGDDAFEGVVSWIEQNGGWDDTVLILTSDHGHYFQLDRPEAMIQTSRTP